MRKGSVPRPDRVGRRWCCFIVGSGLERPRGADGFEQEDLEGCRYGWPLLYDLTLPTTSSAYGGSRAYRSVLASLGNAGTQETLEQRGASDDVDAELLGHLWLDVVSSIVRWWLRHPEESAETAVQRMERVLGHLV